MSELKGSEIDGTEAVFRPWPKGLPCVDQRSTRRVRCGLIKKLGEIHPLTIDSAVVVCVEC